VSDRFVIVGGGLAGGTAAATLRDEGFDGEITLFAAEPHLPYERPPLSKSYLRGETPFDDALVRSNDYWETNGVELRTGTRVTAIDPSRKTVSVQGDEAPFDRLLLATGARNRRFPIPGIDLEGVYALRTVEECDRIREEIEPGRRTVVGGLGFIGSEVTASLRERGVEVTAIDGGGVPLERVLGRQVGGVLEGIHRDHGVGLLFQDRVAAFEGSGRVATVVTSAGRRVECDFAVVGLGVEPAVELALEAGIDTDNGIVVDSLCRTSAPGVFAAGDVANHDHPLFHRRIRTEHWHNARRQGRAAALSMLGRNNPYDEIHWFWSDQYDQNLQYAGFHTTWDDLVVRGSLEDRRFLAFYLQEGVVQSVVGLNRGTDVRASMAMIRSRHAVDPGHLRDEEFDLRSQR
jgi:3-phenylpropionate/trans-cinnamate dioxygenase ferredoxin reductase component